MSDPAAQPAYAAWLGNRAILLAVPLDGTGADVEASLALPDGETPLEAAAMPYGHNGSGGLLVVGRVPAGAHGAGQAVQVTVRAGGEALSARAPELAFGAEGLRALVRNELGALDPEERGRMVAFVLSATADGLRGRHR